MQHVESLTSQIVKEVAVLEGTDVLDLEPPLQYVVDTDALESLFMPSIDGDPREDIRLEFTYSDCRVTIERDDDVHLRVEDRTPE